MIRSALTRFLRSRDGGGTIEAVVWLPLFVALMILAFDITITFYSLNRMWDAARYSARMVSTGQLNAEEARDYALGKLPGHADFDIQIDDSDRDTVTVNIGSSNISPVAGFFIEFSPGALSASYVMRREGF